MTEKSRRQRSKQQSAATASDRPTHVTPEHVSEDEIARRAFELYEARGREDGRDSDDWLQAERELDEQRQRRED